MRTIALSILICLLACQSNKMNNNQTHPYIVVLGIAQDAGYPQANCNKQCCEKAWENKNLTKYVSCIALVDPISKQQWLFDATPDIKFQLQELEKITNINPINGIFLTHAHIGHYVGLLQLGREVMGTQNMPVYAMEKMNKFLKNNAPWNQLIKIKNININTISNNNSVKLNERIKVTPFLVPHRDEYSETVGYKINTDNKSLIFVPDIDKWEDWDINVIEIIKEVDFAFIDGTFYADGELDRDMSEIPHPFVSESIDLFSKMSIEDKEKIYFTHFNHTNPLLQENSKAQQEVISLGFNFAQQGNIIQL
tara:strand:+ start:866 stop:1792 length:927 start_codon:yes stop_codon:yes gene_type:complete